MTTYSPIRKPSHVSSISSSKSLSVKTIKRNTVPNARKTAVSTVLKQHGYARLELIQEKKDINIYHAKRERSENLYKIEEYVDRSQSAASLNYRWLKHENLLPYQDHFENSGRHYFVADISRPNALKYIEEKSQDDGAVREALVRKWMGQLVKTLRYCHRAALYLTDFDWRNTVIDNETENLILNAIDGMTDTTNSGCLQLGPKWSQPPELLRAGGCLRLSVPKIESWVVGCAILELLIGRHLGKPLEQSSQQDTISQAQAWFNIRTNLALLPFWLEGSCLSAKSKEFVLWILNENSHSRPSIDDISHHPWIKEVTSSNEDLYDSDLLKITQTPVGSISYSILKHLEDSTGLSSQLYHNFKKSQDLMPLLNASSIHPVNQTTESETEIQRANVEDLEKEKFAMYLYIICATMALFMTLYVIAGLFL